MNKAHAQMLALDAEASAIKAEIAGMQFYDAHQLSIRSDKTYVEDVYIEKAKELRRIAMSMQIIIQGFE